MGDELMTSVALIFGGKSPEHEVSIVSARYVYSQLAAAGFQPLAVGIGRDGVWHVGEDAFAKLTSSNPAESVPNQGPLIQLAELQADVVFPLVHGFNGEDGSLPGFCQIVGLPYVGGDLLNASLCWDKLATRTVLLANQVAQLPYRAFYKHDYQIQRAVNQVETAFDYPVFVKPARTGSSIGISRARNTAELEAALKRAFSFDYRVLVEPALEGAVELEIAALGGLEPKLSPPAQIITENAFYDFEEKYIKNSARFEVPAQIDRHHLETMCETARRAWRLLNCYGMARIDFLINQDEVYLNEINTCPGFTSISMYPRLMAEAGIKGPELMRSLVELALNRDRDLTLCQSFSSDKDWWKQ